MRVIAGTAKGRRLRAPRGKHTRPTTDAVREAIFASLQSVVDLDGARVADLFAGSGAMGIEALSRGASHATFVDTSREARDAVLANLEATGFDGEVVGADVLAWVRRSCASFDLVFADPPYEFDEWHELATLASRLVVTESDREVDIGAQWEILRVKRYGSTVVTLFRPRESP